MGDERSGRITGDERDKRPMSDERPGRTMGDEPVAPAPRGPAAAHLASIDALRAVACLWVVLYHVGMWWLGAFWLTFDGLAHASGLAGRALIWLTRLGFQGVGLFLVLSGFCLYYPLVRRAGVSGASLALGPYAWRRAGRILPAYYVSILLLWALASWPPTVAVVMRPITRLDLWTHALLVHNLVPASLWTMNGAYWSLALEAQLYVVFPLLVALGRRAGPWSVGLVGLAVSALWPLALRLAGLGQLTGERYGVWYESLPGRLGEFAAGMVAAAVVAEGRAGRVPRWALALLALLWMPASHAVSVARSVAYPVDKLANAVAFAALIVLATRLPPAWWRWAPLRALGAVGVTAYSLYLVHQPALLLLRIPVWELPASQHPYAVPFLVAGGVALSLACGGIFYALVERPVERWRRPARNKTAPD